MVSDNVGAVSACQLLIRVLKLMLTTEVSDNRLMLFPCDCNEEGSFERFAGFSSARDALVAKQAYGPPYFPLVIIGLCPLPRSEDMVGMPWVRALVEWPGFSYIPYGFTKEEFIAVANRVTKGAYASLPSGLLPTVDDVLRVTSEVRHWLENRRRNVEGSLDDFARVLRGEVRLHPSHLEPVAAVSDAHWRMLERLWILDSTIHHFVPLSDGLVPMRDAIGRFEASWKYLESQREELRTAGTANYADRLARTVAALESVLHMIDSAIAASRVLDAAVGLKEST